MGDRPRVIRVFQPLAERATPAERIAHNAEDVREAAALARKRLHDYAQRFVVTGWTIEEDSEEYAVFSRTLIGNLRIKR